MAAQAIEALRRQHQAGTNRVPPHNLQAEESLLGAMLLSRDAIVAAVEVQLTASDFYKPAHGHIFEAITSLYAHGEPADPVTVSEELRRAGLLDAIGGASTLISLQAATPAISNASRYARIVEENSLLRRLIAAAGNIAEIGYTMPEDVPRAVDEAEALIFEVAQRRVTDSLLPIRDLLNRHLDHIEALFERAHDITGVPTGYVDLDQQLAGLQPSNLIIVGGRPGTGKALAVDTPVPTPTGWTSMGALRPGDAVLGGDGQPCRVTMATPVMVHRRCYRVAFDDGSVLIADADHQWHAFDRAALSSGNPRARVVTTQQMVDEGVTVPGGNGANWKVPVAGAVDLPDVPEVPEVPEVETPVDPYDYGARGCVAIPPAWLRGPAKRRLALLQGILDAHGAVSPDGTVEFSAASRHLAMQVRELVCSLGHKPGVLREGVPAAGARPAGSAREWCFSWRPPEQVFGMGEKAERLRAALTASPPSRRDYRAITSITPVPSVPVRCITVDSPDHLYLAGESMIPTHNTSFGLGMAAHAAIEAKKPVLVFSLEMSHLELTQRLLCSEARVDAVRMRNGRLLESDWPKISHAVERLAETPLFIDDNPHLTVMEIRAKARRLKSREGLGLIVVDYLQLMTGRAHAENRQVEVSEISRGLKILARELEVPVVALSQLSRSLETRADKRPVLADLRESGCLTAGTRILRADTGAEVAMGALFASGEHDIPVWSVDENLQMVPAVMSRVFCSGVKAVFELRLASGRKVKATANHRFLSVHGWRRLDQLKLGEPIAVPAAYRSIVSPRVPLLAAAVHAPAPRPVAAAEPAPAGAHAGTLETRVEWHPVVGIKPLGTAAVYDATVAGTHNFVANGIVAHNSLEQDADVVIFIYRDEVYNRDSPDRGTAEIIVAKHRNGPTGVTQLAFLDHYTRFANMAKPV